MAAGVSSDQELLECRIDPGTRHDLRAVEGPHLGLEERQHRVDGIAGDDAFLDQQRFQRHRPRGALDLAVARISEPLRRRLRCCRRHLRADHGSRGDGRGREQKMAAVEPRHRAFVGRRGVVLAGIARRVESLDALPWNYPFIMMSRSGPPAPLVGRGRAAAQFGLSR